MRNKKHVKEQTWICCFTFFFFFFFLRKRYVVSRGCVDSIEKTKEQQTDKRYQIRPSRGWRSVGETH